MTDDRSSAESDPLDQRIRAGVHALAEQAPTPPAVFRTPAGQDAPAPAAPIGRRRALLASAAVIVLVAALATVLIARSKDPDDTVRAGTTTTPAAPAHAPLFATRWILESAIEHGASIDVPEDRRPTVAFDDGTRCVDGCRGSDPSYEFFDGCNHGGGSMRIDGNRIVAEGGPTTLMGCSGPTFAPFDRAGSGGDLSPSTFEIDGDVLVLRDEVGRTLTYRAGDDGLPDRSGEVLVESGGMGAFQLVSRVDADRAVLSFDRTYQGTGLESATLEANAADPPRLIADKAHATGGDLLYGLVPAATAKVTYTPSKTDPIDIPIRSLDGTPLKAIATLVPRGDQKWSVVATDAAGREIASQDVDYTGQTIDPFDAPEGEEVGRGATNYGQYRVAWKAADDGGRLTLDRASATTVLPPVSIDVDTTEDGPDVTAGLGHTSVHTIVYGVVRAEARRVTYERTAGDRGPFELELGPLPDTDRQVVVGAVPSGPAGTIRVYDDAGTEIASYPVTGD